MMKSITSSKNENLKKWMSLLSSKGIRSAKQFLIFGSKPVTEMIYNEAGKIFAILTIQDYAAEASRLESLVSKKREPPPVYWLDKNLMTELDPFGTRFPILVCGTTEFPIFDPGSPPKGLELLVPAGNPSNLGAILRSAMAFKANKVVLLKESAHPCHPKSIRALSGNIYRIPFEVGPSIHDLSSAQGLWGLDLKGQDISKMSWPKNVRLLVGEEGPGVPNVVGNRIHIPIAGEIESLNAAIAASIALFSYRSQHSL